MTPMFDASSLYDGSTPVATLPSFAGEGGSSRPDAAGTVLDAEGWGRGHLALVLSRRDGATHLRHLYQRTPLRAFFPRHDCGELAVAAIANVGGGLVAGDVNTIDVRVGPDAAALVTTQAAEKIYRSTGPDCRLETSLRVEAGGWLEWCPQETILFDHSRLRRSLEIDLAAGARAMLGEIVVLGRLASGERSGQGLLHDRIEVRTDGEPVWCDVLRLAGDYRALVDAPAGLASARGVATFVYAAPDAAAQIDLARSLLPAGLAGATLVDGVPIVRLLGHEPLALRHAFAMLWARFRAGVAGLPACLPRVWHV